MRNSLRILTLCVIAAFLSSCAYVEYRRIYDIQPRLSAEQRVAVGDVIERYFSYKGYNLKQKYHDYEPDDAYVTVFQIPRSAEQKVREPYIYILVKKTGVVQLKHLEWFFEDSLFTESKNKPQDLIASVKSDLVIEIKKNVGVTVDIQLSDKGYY